MNRKAADRVASGHPWIFSSDIADRNGAQPGQPVKVADIRKAPMEYHLGYEFWEFQKLLGVRLGYEWSQRGASTGFSHLSAGLSCAPLFDVHEIQILAPIAAMLIQMAISRSREYDADAASAKYVGSPYPLIGGLQKLETWSKRIPMDASPATAHMFIIKPFSGQSMMRLFSTHPSTEDRIARLQAMR